ncbi:glycosyltransferase [Janibacter hoylei]|uniref:glycosyltransferase n=1 Tax=Janibacter hoylei TaxID=364298 RepID=UPI001930A748|nr:glycosyltransferase [Janibacter hoylei]
MRASTRQWLRAHSHVHTDFDATTLVEHLRAKGETVAVVIPARDESATVGDVVTGLRRELVEQVPLVSELVVVDSDSTDDTAAVAADAGATVHRAADIAPHLGAHPGKGEALWKSLFVTSADLLVFVDADLTQWWPHFVTGLVGALTADPRTQLVKAGTTGSWTCSAGHPAPKGAGSPSSSPAPSSTCGGPISPASSSPWRGSGPPAARSWSR